MSIPEMFGEIVEVDGEQKLALTLEEAVKIAEQIEDLTRTIILLKSAFIKAQAELLQEKARIGVN
jgi:hypothetical protein